VSNDVHKDMGDDAFDGRKLLCHDEKIIYARNKSCPKIGCVFSAVEILIIGSQTNETVQSEFQIQRLI
jgi:hypothetical protein